jgi:hypothetical protein
MIQYSLLRRTAASTRLNTTFRGLHETMYSNELMRLCAWEDYIELFNIITPTYGGWISLNKACYHMIL